MKHTTRKSDYCGHSHKVNSHFLELGKFVLSYIEYLMSHFVYLTNYNTNYTVTPLYSKQSDFRIMALSMNEFYSFQCVTSRRFSSIESMDLIYLFFARFTLSWRLKILSGKSDQCGHSQRINVPPFWGS